MNFIGNLFDRFLFQFGEEWQGQVALVKGFGVGQIISPTNFPRIGLMLVYGQMVVQTSSDSVIPEVLHQSFPILALDDIEVHGVKFLEVAMGKGDGQIAESFVIQVRQLTAPGVVGVQVLEFDPQDRSLQFVQSTVDTAMNALSFVIPAILA